MINFFKKRLISTFSILFLSCLALSAQSQSFIVEGKVLSQENEPLAGVGVTIKNTTNGTATDTNGHYSIKVPDKNAILLFSILGFKTKEVVVGSQKNIIVKLEESMIQLDNVVVVGYGTQKKVNVTGAVSSVTVNEALTDRSVPNVSSALQGLMPGLAVSQNSGMAGNNSSKLLIRGLGTINNSSPLIVVDDMPDIDINRINMNDIESISILKDAAASSVYGSRAANGVILVKTKSGKKNDKTQISFSGTKGWETPTNYYDFMDDYPRALTLHQRSAATAPGTNGANQVFKNGTIDQWLALGMIDEVRYPNTDWWDVITRTGSTENYNLSARGGNDKSNFYASIGYHKQEGLQINNDYERYNARFNADYKLRNNINFGFKFDGNWSNYVYSYDDGFTGQLNDMQYAIAGIYPYEAKRDLYGGAMAYGEDPMAFNAFTFYKNVLKKENRQEANTAFYLDWEPIKGLVARVDYNLSYYNQLFKEANIPNRAYNFQTEGYGSRWFVSENANITNRVSTGYKTLMNARLNYHKKFGSSHDFSAMFIHSKEYWNDRYLMASRENRIHPTLSEIDAALTTTQGTGGNSSAEALSSFIGRINYSAYGKYLLELNMRADGSSKFQAGNRYGYFPSASLGWIFSEEEFLRSLSNQWLTSGKFRVSYGELGNNSGIGRYQQQEILYQNNYMIGTSIANGFVYSKMLNKDLSWESTAVLNMGLDMIYLNGKLSTEFDYYDRLTTGMLQRSQVSMHLTGAYEAAYANLGNLRNRGVEANITWKDRINDFRYTVNFNVSYNRSRLERWAEFLDKGYVYVNMPYQYLYTYLDKGLAQSWQDSYSTTPQGAAPGDVIRKDVNGDGLVDTNDRVASPNNLSEMPTTNYGLNLQMSWKGFDLSMLFQAATGRKDFWINVYNTSNLPKYRYASSYEQWNDTWSWENRGASRPRLGGASTNMSETSLWMDDMSYLRLKNVMLGYSLPKSWLQKLSVSSLRIYGSAENLFTLTNYRGLDPEKVGSTVDVYPLTKSFSVGVNVSF
ncbi:MAG: TonB-dependent receptor [Bacteroidales bacterium]|nr:TonB-dependent receptor [Bacteroidales bacterium]